MPQQPSISETELALLHDLWDHGPGTVRDLLNRLQTQGRRWAYTTVQTMLTRLVGKGYVAVDRSGSAHIYQAAVTRSTVLQQRLADLAEAFCGGTSSPLVLALVDGGQFTAEEIAQFRELLDRLEAEQAGRPKRRTRP